mmetsp:Transcript_13519/g.31945  ORF Transcript_13519/g.31945 Transcript_13519/m.31945 type:complete len:116 (-) Transcript_13519:201-548(-)
MSSESCPKLDFVAASETIITVSFKPCSTAEEYILEWKEYPQKWELAQSRTIAGGPGKDKWAKDGGGIQANIEDLNPGTSYAVRLRASSNAKPSPELIIDTEAVSCAPKSSACMIM